jgi:hypothetical protein
MSLYPGDDSTTSGLSLGASVGGGAGGASGLFLLLLPWMTGIPSKIGGSSSGKSHPSPSTTPRGEHPSTPKRVVPWLP